MKYLVALFLTVSAFFGSNYLIAAEVANLTYFWTGDEVELDLNINLSKELEFADTYRIMKTQDGQGLACEVICKPISGSSVFSSEGYELQEIEFTVIVHNVDDPNEVAYATITKSSFKGVNEKGLLVSQTSKSQRSGVLNTHAIDLNQEPVFFTIDEGGHEGVISFKNSH